MMTLSTMWSVDRLNRSEGGNPLAEELLGRFHHDPNSARHFRSSANFLFVFRAAGEPHFLRFVAASERPRSEIAAEIDLVNWLSETGILVARPVPSYDGRMVETIETMWGTYHAVVLPAVHGESWSIQEMGMDAFEKWGAALGQLHAAIARYRTAEPVARKTSEQRLAAAFTTIVSLRPGVQEELDSLQSALHTLPTPPHPLPVIHGDFELDNLVWGPAGVGILDFDDCHVATPEADVAYALRDLFPHAFDPTLPALRAFI
ncbi:MAG: hypothetical protein NVSMB52_20990 [Chloroflexota bacterium]